MGEVTAAEDFPCLGTVDQLRALLIRRPIDWVKMDLEYIDNWSLWLDFRILLRTVWVVVRGTGS